MATIYQINGYAITQVKNALHKFSFHIFIENRIFNDQIVIIILINGSFKQTHSSTDDNRLRLS